MATNPPGNTSTAPDADLAAEVERLRAERDALQAKVARQEQQRRRGGLVRRIGVVILVVLSCISFTAATVGVWADRTLLDTDGWVETVGPLGSDSAVTNALQARITQRIGAVLPLQDVIGNALPENATFLAAPLSSAVLDFIDREVGAFLATDEFQQLWVEANTVAHTQAVALLRGGSDVAQIQGDTVVLNLLPIINQALQRLEGVASELVGSDVDLPTITSGEVPEQARDRLSQALGVDLPEDFGQITIYNADELAAVQQALLLFDRLLVLFLVLTPVLVIAALWLSANRRRTLLQLLIGTMLLLVVVRRIGFLVQDRVVDLAAQETGKAAVQSVADQLLDGLFALTQTLLIVGLVLVVLALITGPYAWAVALRRRTMELWHAATEAGGRAREGMDTTGAVRWTQANLRPLQIAGTVVAALVLLFANVSWLGLLLVLIVLAGYESALWRMGDGGTPPEEPQPTTTAPSGMA